MRAEWLARLDRAAFRLVLGSRRRAAGGGGQAVEIFTECTTTRRSLWRGGGWRSPNGAKDGTARPSSRPRGPSAARVAADVYEETRAIDSLCTGLLYGPTPRTEAAEQCRVLLSGAEGRPATQANVLASLAELEAMLGHFDAAREAYGRSRAIYEELGCDAARGLDDDRCRTRAPGR